MTLRLGLLALLLACCTPPVATPSVQDVRSVAPLPLPFPVTNDIPRPHVEIRGVDGRPRLDLHAGTRLDVNVTGPVRRTAWSIRLAPRTAPVVVRVEVPPAARVIQLAVDGRAATPSASSATEPAPSDALRVDVPVGDRETEIAAAYVEHRAGDEPRVAATILPPVPVTIDLVVDGNAVHVDSRAPHADVVAPRGPELGLVFAGDGDEGWFALPVSRAARPETNERVAILVDTSARAARHRGRALRWLEAVVRALPRDTEITIGTFDHTSTVVAQGRAGDIDGRAVAGVATRERLGVARWSRALRDLAVPEGKGVRVVVIGAEAGPPFDLTDAEAADLARELEGRGVRRIDVVGLEGASPEPWLAALVRTGTGGFVFDASASDPKSLAALFQLPAPPEAMGTTCRSLEPSRVDDVHASRRPIVVGRGCPASPALTLSGREVRATVVSVPRIASIARGATLVGGGDQRTAAVRFALGGGTVVTTPTNATKIVSQTSWDPLVAFEDHRPAASIVIPDAPPVPAPEPAPPPTDTVKVVGKLPPEIVQRVVRLNAGRFKGCYREALLKKRDARGSVVTTFRIGSDGNVSEARVVAGDFPLEWMRACVARSFGAINFPAPPDGVVDVRYGLAFDDGAGGSPTPVRLAVPAPAAPGAPIGPAEPAAPTRGTVLAIHEASGRNPAEGVSQAEALVAAAPESRLALALLGDAATHAGRDALAERAYASVFSDRDVTSADLRLFGARLRALGTEEAKRLGTSALVRASVVAPEETNGALLGALAYAADGDLPRAAELLEQAIAARASVNGAPAAGRPAVDDPTTAVLVDLYTLVLSAWSAREPWRKNEHRSLLATLGTDLRTADALRVIATWEAPGDNVDLDVTDGVGSHAVPGHPVAQGGELRADDRDGAGVDMFGADGPAQARLGPFRVQLRTGELRAPHVSGTVAVVERVEKRIAVTFHAFVMNVPEARADVTTIEASALVP